MREVFRQQTVDAWQDRRWRTLLPVLWCATSEVFTKALPARAASPALLASASSLVFTTAMFWCLLWALTHPLAVKAAERRLQGAVCHPLR